MTKNKLQDSGKLTATVVVITNTRTEQLLQATRVLVLSNNRQLIMFCSPFVFDSHEIKQFNAEAIIYLFVIIPVLSDKRLFQLF